jgi:hypothetical protein
VCGYSDYATDGRLGARIQVGAGDFSVLRNVQSDSGVHSGSYSMCTEDLSWGQSGRDVKLAEVKECETILLLLYVFLAWTGSILP